MSKFPILLSALLSLSVVSVFAETHDTVKTENAKGHMAETHNKIDADKPLDAQEPKHEEAKKEEPKKEEEKKDEAKPQDDKLADAKPEEKKEEKKEAKKEEKTTRAALLKSEKSENTEKKAEDKPSEPKSEPVKKAEEPEDPEVMADRRSLERAEASLKACEGRPIQP